MADIEIRVLDPKVISIKPHVNGVPLDAKGIAIKGDPGRDGADGRDGRDGRDGADGKDFKYEDFTPEQLEALRGPEGQRGPAGESIKGDKGDPFRYSDFTQAQLEALRGPQGPQGQPGPKGEPGTISEETQAVIVAEVLGNIPEWSKSPIKPSYTASEVGALPNTTVIPTDSHINELINTALGGIENGTY